MGMEIVGTGTHPCPGGETRIQASRELQEVREAWEKQHNDPDNDYSIGLSLDPQGEGFIRPQDAQALLQAARAALETGNPRSFTIYDQGKPIGTLDPAQVVKALQR